jgi:hypothetical protein
MGSRFTAWISVRNKSTQIPVDRLRQLIAREHAAKLLACYGILFQGMGYLGSVHLTRVIVDNVFFRNRCERYSQTLPSIQDSQRLQALRRTGYQWPVSAPR